MTAKLADARATGERYVSGKAAQAGAFGQEYVHNVGAAAKTIGKYSRAAHVAKAAMAMGADPLTAGAAAGVTYFATTRRPAGPGRAPASQVRPQTASLSAAPANRSSDHSRPDPAAVPKAEDLHGSSAVAELEADRAAFLAGMRQRAADRARRQTTIPPALSVPQGRR